MYSRDWQRKMADVLKLLGTEHAMIVHSNGLDEIRLDAPSHVVELRDGKIEEYEISPTDFGVDLQTPTAVASLAASSTESSLELVKAALTQDDSLAADIVSLNAGAAIYVSGVATNLANGVTMAQDAIGAGLAKERFDELVRVTKMMGEE